MRLIARRMSQITSIAGSAHIGIKTQGNDKTKWESCERRFGWAMFSAFRLYYFCVKVLEACQTYKVRIDQYKLSSSRNTWLPEFYIEVAFELLYINQHCLCCQMCINTENKTLLYMFLHLSLGHCSVNPVSVKRTSLYSNINTLNVVYSLDRNKNLMQKTFMGFLLKTGVAVLAGSLLELFKIIYLFTPHA